MGKESACSAGDTGDVGWIPGSGKSPGGGNGNPLQSSCLENAMDRGALWTTAHGVTCEESDVTEHTGTEGLAQCWCIVGCGTFIENIDECEFPLLVNETEDPPEGRAVQ